MLGSGKAILEKIVHTQSCSIIACWRCLPAVVECFKLWVGVPLIFTWEDGSHASSVVRQLGSFELLLKHFFGYIRVYVQLLVVRGLSLLELLILFIDL